MNLCGLVSSLWVPQDANDEDVALFDSEEDAGKRATTRIRFVSR